MSELADAAKALAKSPLGIIALFLLIVYGLAVSAIDSEQIMNESEAALVNFAVWFPGVILFVFTILVLGAPHHLYGPGDFKDDETFLKVLGGPSLWSRYFTDTADAAAVEPPTAAAAGSVLPSSSFEVKRARVGDDARKRVPSVFLPEFLAQSAMPARVARRFLVERQTLTLFSVWLGQPIEEGVKVRGIAHPFDGKYEAGGSVRLVEVMDVGDGRALPTRIRQCVEKGVVARREAERHGSDVELGLDLVLAAVDPDGPSASALAQTVRRYTPGEPWFRVLMFDGTGFRRITDSAS